MEARVLAALRAAGFGDLTAARGRVFARIGPHGTRLTDLAEQAQITKQSAGFLVDQLERAGYVERVPDPSDGRARLVRLAARGREAQVCARAMEEEVEAELAGVLGPRRTRELREALEALRDVTDPYL